MSFIALLDSVSEKEVRRLQGGPAVSLQCITQSRPSISEPSLPQVSNVSVFQQRFKDAQACHVQISFTGKHTSEPDSQAACQAQPLERPVNENGPTPSQCDLSHGENSQTCRNTPGIAEQVPNEPQPRSITQQDGTVQDTDPHSPVKYASSHAEELPDSLEILAEEERMRRIHADKARAQAEKSMVLQAKAQKAKERAQDLHERKRAENEQRLSELDLRMEVATGRREEDLKLRRIRGEERQLRLADARAEKDRIARLDGYRRERLQTQIDAKQERLELFLAVTDEFRDQRKRNRGTAPRLKSFVDALPGPGQYDARASTIATAAAPKISASRSASVLEKLAGVIYGSPPPSSYFS